MGPSFQELKKPQESLEGQESGPAPVKRNIKIAHAIMKDARQSV